MLHMKYKEKSKVWIPCISQKSLVVYLKNVYVEQIHKKPS